MIWQLMKRDLTWQWTPLAAIFALLFTLKPSTSDMLILVMLAMINWSQPAFKTYCTLYEGVLPIRSRDLWLSRILILLAGIWAPVGAVWMIRLARGGPVAALLDAASAYTVAVLATKCVRSGQFTPPDWFKGIGIAVFATTGAFLEASDRFLPPTAVVLGVCAIASAALFYKGWTSLPKAFQLAPVNMGSTRAPEVKPHSRFAWAPLIGSLYGLPGLLLLSLCFLQMVLGSFLFWFVLLISVQWQARARMRWILHLPVSSRTLFAIVAVPPAAAIVGGSILNIFFDNIHPLPAATRIVSITIQIVILYAVFATAEMFRWKRLSRFAPLVKGLPAIIAFAALAVAFALSARDGRSLLDGPSGRIAAAFSGNWVLLGAAIAAAVAIAFELAQRVFAELEYPNLRITEWGKWSGS